MSIDYPLILESNLSKLSKKWVKTSPFMGTFINNLTKLVCIDIIDTGGKNNAYFRI